MKIAVVGMGVAGGYLAARLAQGSNHVVHGFDSLPSVSTRCAWGGSRHELSKILSAIEVDFTRHILFTGRRMNVVFEDLSGFEVPLNGLVTFDKDGLETEVLAKAEASGVKITRGVKVTLESLGHDYDLVVDATGVYRSLLPKIQGDMIFPNLEYRVRYHSSPPYTDFAVFPYSRLGGYTWFFPLGDNLAHVGGGDYFHRQKEYVNSFMAEHGGEVVKTIGRPVRMVPPSKAEPIYVERDGLKVVGVGESIGAVFPLVGEGIIPGLQSAELLYRSIEGTRVDVEQYRRSLRRKFFYFEPVFNAILAKWAHTWSAAKMGPRLLPTLLRLSRMERRFGFKMTIGQLFDVFEKT